MANKKSAKKDIIKNKRNKLRNGHFKSLMKTSIKKALSAIESNSEDSTSLVRIALKQIDKTVAKGIIHKNKGNRKKSSLSKKSKVISVIEAKEEKKSTKKVTPKTVATKNKTTKAKKETAEK